MLYYHFPHENCNVWGVHPIFRQAHHTTNRINQDFLRRQSFPTRFTCASNNRNSRSSAKTCPKNMWFFPKFDVAKAFFIGSYASCGVKVL